MPNRPYEVERRESRPHEETLRMARYSEDSRSGRRSPPHVSAISSLTTDKTADKLHEHSSHSCQGLGRTGTPRMSDKAGQKFSIAMVWRPPDLTMLSAVIGPDPRLHPLLRLKLQHELCLSFILHVPRFSA